MAYLCTDKNGTEMIFDGKPHKHYRIWKAEYFRDGGVELPKGSIRKLIGHDLTWNDDPVELTEVGAHVSGSLSWRTDEEC